MGCPYQCIYCNQKAITRTPTDALNWESYTRIVETGLSSRKLKTGQEVEIAFFGGTFTHLPSALQNHFLRWAGSYIIQNRVKAIRLSTRPDGLTKEKIDFLTLNGVKTIELGLQSLNDTVLSLANRGHTVQEAIQAVHLLKQFPVRVGIQLMAGLPGDSEQGFLKTVEQTIALKPDLVRIYPTLVFQDTPLAQWLQEGRYTPLTLDEAVSLCSLALERFVTAEIPVIRLGLQDHPGMGSGQGVISGPFHPAFGSLVRGELYLNNLIRNLITRRMIDPPMILEVASRDIGYLMADKKKNLYRLIQELGSPAIEVKKDPRLGRGEWRWIEKSLDLSHKIAEGD
jgi:histone acetyltransferase (RNA polymerase elongator complex component)